MNSCFLSSTGKVSKVEPQLSFKYSKDDCSTLDKIHFFHNESPSNIVSWDIINQSVCEKIADYPAIFWKPFIESVSGNNTHHYIKLKKTDTFFSDNPFLDEFTKISSENIFDDLNGYGVVHISYIYMDDKNNVRNSLFKIEKYDKFFRVTEYDTCKIMTNGKYCSMVKTFYFTSRDDIYSFIDFILNSSIGFYDNKKTENTSSIFFNADKFVNLEKGHCSIGRPVLKKSSGIFLLLLATNMVSVDFVFQISNMNNIYDFINSEQNKKYVKNKEKSRITRLDVEADPCRMVVEDGKHVQYPGAISSHIDIKKMANYPIVQGLDPRLPHSLFKQPYKVVAMTHENNSESIKKEEMAEIGEKINRLLQDSNFRESCEKDFYSYKKITKKNVKKSLYDFTLGINGVTAKKNIPRLTPVVYKQQYTEEFSDEHMAIISTIKNYLGVCKNFNNKKIEKLSDWLELDNKIFKDAERLRQTYSWALPSYQLTNNDSTRDIKLWCNGWGNGGVTTGFNGDSSKENKYVNHAALTFETVDEEGKPAPPIIVYISLRDIEKNEELLVSYGSAYIFDVPQEKGYVSTVNTAS